MTRDPYMKSWSEMISAEMSERGDDGPVLASVPEITSSAMTRPFHTGYGESCGCAFTAWTETRVYFPVVYDGAEWVGSAPRNPCDEATGHQGGQ